MLIREFVETKPDAGRLAALSKFLAKRADDEAARKQISQDAFIEAAKSLGVNITAENLGDLISQDPLKNLLEPFDPNSGVIRFKGDTEATTGMSVDQARSVVDANAKQAMKRRM